MANNFNPRPPRGGRRSGLLTIRRSSVFQSTPPARGATVGRGEQGDPQADDFNPRPPRGGRLHQAEPPRRSRGISIHAPREGGDLRIGIGHRIQQISIHAPREGGDWQPAGRIRRRVHFNPRPPRGGRRSTSAGAMTLSIFQSTPPARGATLQFHFITVSTNDISIHAPREGGDGQLLAVVGDLVISIHAPREGGDDVLGGI